MNRRHFNSLLAALPVTSFLPKPLTAAMAPQTASVPAGTYAWAQLIARAQNRCSPAMLARQLRLEPAAAEQLFNEMVRDGVLRAPSAAGIAQATQPINATGRPVTSLRQSLTKLRDAILSDEQNERPRPLAKAQEPCLGCIDDTKEDADASPDKPVQESPARG